MIKEKEDVEDTTKINENPWAEFQPYLDDVDIPDDQKQAFLEIIWSLMVEFVALGFGADATSQAIAAHLADALDNNISETKSPKRLASIFSAVQPNIEPKSDCEASV